MIRRLGAEEEALWARVTATVRPLHPARPAPERPAGTEPAPPLAPRRSAGPARTGHGKGSALPPAQHVARPRTGSLPAREELQGENLDGAWDRRLSSGRVHPELVIDLHGMNREAARHLLYRRVHDAEMRGLRVILVITGKGHQPGPAAADLMPGLGGQGAMRGAIRADLPRWIGEEGLSTRIAAIRRAHPRHGGAGAAYLILKRRRA